MTSKETAKGKSSWKTLTGRGNLDREEENGDNEASNDVFHRRCRWIDSRRVPCIRVIFA